MNTAQKPKETTRMTEGTIWKRITAFALPIFLGNLFQQLYNTADSLIVGNFLGSNALAAVSSSGNLIFLMVGFFNGIAMGAGVVIARYYGAKEFDRVRKSVHTTIALGIAAGIVLTVAGNILTSRILVWMGTPADVLPESTTYFRIYFMGSLSFVMYNIFVGILQSVGDSRHPLAYLIFSSVVNVLLDLLFVGVMGFGVGAAALATILSQFLSALLCLYRLVYKSPEDYRVILRSIRFDLPMLKQIIANGLPAGFQNSIIAFANVIVQSQINSFGKLAMAAYGTHAKIEGFAFLPITSFNMASTTFISQNLGAKEYDRAKKGARFSILSAMVLAEAIGVCCYIFAPKLIGLFDSNPGVIELGVRQARTVSLFFCLLAFSHAVAAVCRGAGKAFVPMCVMLAVWCLVRITYIIAVMKLTNEIGYIYWAYPLTWGISSVIYLFYYLCCDWVHGFDKAQNGAGR